MNLRELAAESKLQCNCDLDNWEPERDTGHSWVCQIDKEARKKMKDLLYNRKKGGGEDETKTE